VEQRATRLFRVLFRAPGDLRSYWAFLEALAREISPDACAVSIVESLTPAPSTVVFGPGFQHAAAGVLALRSTPRRQAELGEVGALFEIPRPSRELRRSPVVRALFEPEGIVPGPGLGVVLVREEGRAAAVLAVLPKNERWAPSAADRALLDTLAPSIADALRLHRRIVGAGAITSLLDHLVLGVVLLDDRGRVTYANRSAAELLDVEPGLSELARVDGRDPRTEALRRVVPPGNANDFSVRAHPVDGRPLQVLFTALSWPDPLGSEARNFARAIFVGDSKRAGGAPLESLESAYGFTPSEAKLAGLLAADLTLANAATELGITESTARTVLKRILAKTGTRRQASLVRLLLSGPAQLRTDGSPGAPPTARAPRPRRH
jgi:PAS domain-containing protein/DNA-binding CsgD family transcriptional regulator